MTSGSSVSVQRSLKSVDHRSNSCDTVCTSNSSCVLQRRKPMNPLMYPVRPTYQKNSGNGVRQRVLSAKLLKLRSIQNQLNDANFHLSELSKENQILKNLQKRQDKALSKYEGMNEDLPRLLHAHEEQTRVITEKNKTLRKNLKELTELFKSKEEELTRVNEKLVHLEKLNRDKHLTDREKLLDQLEDTKLKLQKSEEQVTILNRKLMLESKTSKQRLNSEISKHKLCQRQLNQALSEIDRMSGLLEAKENVVHPRPNRLARRSTQRQTMSMVSLDSYQPKRTASSDKLSTIYDSETDLNNKVSTISESEADGNNKVTTIYDSEADATKTPVKDVKLEPIRCKTGDTTKKLNGILTMPSENIKNRLSNGSTPSRGSVEFSLNAEKEHSSGSETLLDSRENSADSEKKTRYSSYSNFDKLPDTSFDTNKEERSRPNSSIKLEKLSKHLDQAIQRATEKTNDEFEKKLGIYCSEIVSNVKNCNERVELQKESLKLSQEDTNNILETFEKTKKVESKLRKSFLNFEGADSEFLNGILSDELKLQTNSRDDNGTDKNGNVMKKDKVKLEERKKLLATLKAIDNEENIEIVGNSPSHDLTNLMHGILGDMPK